MCHVGCWRITLFENHDPMSTIWIPECFGVLYYKICNACVLLWDECVIEFFFCLFVFVHWYCVTLTKFDFVVFFPAWFLFDRWLKYDYEYVCECINFRDCLRQIWWGIWNDLNWALVNHNNVSNFIIYRNRKVVSIRKWTHERSTWVFKTTCNLKMVYTI